jgi:hypothetical protein
MLFVSSRAGWPGNDETHFEKRWADKNPEDIKRLIGATVQVIAMKMLVVFLPAAKPHPGEGENRRWNLCQFVSRSWFS